MGGSFRVVRRLSMASLAFGLAFGIPNLARAQAPRFEPSRLPWQTVDSLAQPKAFDQSWMRVVVDTQLLLRRFSTSYPLPGALDIDTMVQSAVNEAVWGVTVQTVPSQTPEPVSLDVAPIRATFTPVPFTSGVAAESRGMEGTLVGVKVEWVD